jgi:hypothetical protein
MEPVKTMPERERPADDKGPRFHDFWPVKLERRMRLYRDAMGLMVGYAAQPDPEFLFKILTSHSSHQAMLRAGLKPGYKSLENYLRGRKTVSPDTLTRLAAESGIAPEKLQAAAHGSKTGPLWPELQRTLWWIENIGGGTFSAATSTPVLCPHCSANVIDDVDPWWNALNTTYGFQLGRPEYRFAERLLRAMAGWITLQFFLVSIGSNPQADPRPGARLLTLASPSKHPIGTWLAEVMAVRNCTTLNELLLASPIIDEESDGLSRQRLKAWSSGHDLIPFTIGENLLHDLPNSAELLLQFRLARCLAFVQDFVAATAVSDGTMAKHAERRVVFDRLGCLFLNIELSLAAARGTLHIRSTPGPATAS